MSNNEYISKLNDEEKIRLFDGNGSWNTYDAGGKIPRITMSDGPHGLRVQNFENYADLNKSNIATCFPTASCLASSWNKNLLRSVGKAIAHEAQKEKVNIVLGPGINIKRSPLCGRNFEYFSEDPYLSGILATEYVKGMQEEGVGCSLKHFAANNQEKRRQTSNSIIDERTLHEIYLRGFEMTVKNANPVSIMESYNRVNGPYVSHSKYLLTDVLREKWGFKGFVISDWGACINPPECAKAGLDLAMPDSNGYFSKSLKKALAEKTIEISDIEKANQRVIDAAVSLKQSEKTVEVDYSVQNKIALNAALDSAVLLKNDGMLPLASKKIVVVGELAEFMKFQGGGSSHITTADYPNALLSLEKLGYEVFYEKGYYSGFCKNKKVKSKNRPLKKSALNMVKAFVDDNKDIPVLFFCGLTEKYEGEGFDRENLNLPEEQLSLLNEILEITKNVAVVSFSGSAICMPYADNVRSILHMYLAGQSCGEACALLLSGGANPSGKLTESFPWKVEDTPAYKNFALEEDNVEYREEFFVGYRHYESKKIPVQFEFGFGLSYTSFEYSDFTVKQEGENYKATVSITNTGKVAGKETVQFYIENPHAHVESQLRAKIELRGFEKVELLPGETKCVEVYLDDNSFKVYSIDSGKFETVEGEYLVYAAASVKNKKLVCPIKVEGKKLETLVKEVPESYWKEKAVVQHTKGSYTMSDSLGDMAKTSGFVRKFLKILIFALQMMNKGKSKEDPAVKIAISAISENPVESLISTSGGAINEKLARFLVKSAN